MIDDGITEEQALEVDCAGIAITLENASISLINITQGRAAYAASIAIDRLKTLADPTEEELSAAVKLYVALTGKNKWQASLREVLTQFVASRRAPAPAPDLAPQAVKEELNRQQFMAGEFDYAAIVAVVRASDAAQKEVAK